MSKPNCGVIVRFYESTLRKKKIKLMDLDYDGVCLFNVQMFLYFKIFIYTQFTLFDICDTALFQAAAEKGEVPCIQKDSHPLLKANTPADDHPSTDDQYQG